jgi:CHAT domain-containing protein
MARAERERGNLTVARTLIEPSLSRIESIRNNITSQELRAVYFASIQEYYEFYIDVLMRLHRESPSQGFDATALEVSERGRARSLLELLTEAGAEIRQGVDANLLERERSLQQRLSGKTQYQIQVLNALHTDEEAAAVKKEIDDLTTAYQEVEAQIRATSPRYTALTQPQPLSLKDIQQQVLDSETLLLEYSLGDKRSYLWAVTQDSITSYELPKRTEIEKVARRFYELLITPNQRSEASNKNRGLRVMRAGAQSKELSEAAAILSQILLEPVASRLETKRLLIVPDGALQYVPFAALLNPTTHKQGYQPLILTNEIVNLPSASTLSVLRHETTGRKPAAKCIAVLADPVFSSDDERIGTFKSAKNLDHPSSSLDNQRGLLLKVKEAASELGIANVGLNIPRLLGTRQEAERILALAPVGMSKQALDFDASRTLVMSGELGQYRLVHFATHGFLNNEHLELSGIVLSLFDRQGKEQNGFLLAHEVYNLKLSADLVVLSACETGLGKELKGEGLIGLTRAFMYAGAPRVVVSLWSVNDKATAKLMEQFYRGMLVQGLRPAAALRAAQIEMWKQKQWQSPYYWAAFVLQGEWK